MTGAMRVLGNDDVASGVLQIYATAASQSAALGRKLTWFTWLLSRQLFSDINNQLHCEMAIDYPKIIPTRPVHVVNCCLALSTHTRGLLRMQYPKQDFFN